MGLIPPLAELIQMMRDESQELHRTLKSPKVNQTESEKKACDEKLVKVRNLKLLIQDIFKQFDLLFKEIDIQEQMEDLNKEGDKHSQGINLGELQEDSVQSFTDLLYMQNIDKKLLTALGDFMFRISNFNYAKNQTKN